MRSEQLKYVVATNNYCSMSKAAEALFITQPTLSRAITSLEKELDVQLFHRFSYGVSLTPIGERLLPQIEIINQEIAKLQALIQEEKKQDIVATIRVSASPIMCNNFLPDAIALFQQNYPSIDIDIHEEYTTDTIQSLCSNKADIGFLSLPDTFKEQSLSVLSKKNIYYKFFLKSSLVVLFSANSPLAQLDNLSEDQLSTYPLILDKKLKSIVPQKVLSKYSVIYCQDREARNKMILKSQGYTIIPALELHNDYYVQEKLMIVRPYPRDLNKISLWTLYNKPVLTFYEEDFIDILTNFLMQSQ